MQGSWFCVFVVVVFGFLLFCLCYWRVFVCFSSREESAIFALLHLVGSVLLSIFFFSVNRIKPSPRDCLPLAACCRRVSEMARASTHPCVPLHCPWQSSVVFLGKQRKQKRCSASGSWTTWAVWESWKLVSNPPIFGYSVHLIGADVTDRLCLGPSASFCSFCRVWVPVRVGSSCIPTDLYFNFEPMFFFDLISFISIALQYCFDITLGMM